MKKISSRQLATLKRNAQSSFPYFVKVSKLKASIADLQAQLEEAEGVLEATETGSRIITGGFNSLEVIERVLVETGKTDKDGRALTQTKWVAKADAVVANEDGTYTIVLEKDAAPAEPVSAPEAVSTPEPVFPEVEVEEVAIVEE